MTVSPGFDHRRLLVTYFIDDIIRATEYRNHRLDRRGVDEITLALLP